MFGIGMPEMLLILAIALIVIGPKKLPDLAKSIGRALGEFKKATNEIKQSIEVDDNFKEVKKAFTEVNEDIKDSVRLDSAEIHPPQKKNTISENVDPSSKKPPPVDSDTAMDDLKTAFNSMEASEQSDLSAEHSPPDQRERDLEAPKEEE
jgi:sec-independent protein translocase protein TatB